MNIFHGNILFSKNSRELAVYEDSYLVADHGKVEGIYAVLPEQYQGAEITDYGSGVIIPAFPTSMCMLRSMLSAVLEWTCFFRTGLINTPSRRNPVLRI